MIKLNFQQPSMPLLQETNLPQVLSISNVCNNPTWFYDMHKHDDYCEIMFIQDGCGTYTLDNIPYSVEKGDIIVINKGVVHAEMSDAVHPLSVWTCSVGNIHLNGMEENKIIQNQFIPVIATGELSSDFERCFQYMYQEYIS